MQCENTFADGAGCQGTYGHNGPCFIGGALLADFDRVAVAKAEAAVRRRALEGLKELIDAWGSNPINVTGEGAKRFLAAVHACECVADSLPSRSEIMEVEMTELNVDGLIDEKGIKYIGQATRRPNGQWVCLADVNGCLCLVEVKIRLLAKAI